MATRTRLEAFIRDWRPDLEKRARVRFEAFPAEYTLLAPAKAADEFVRNLGFEGIGNDWELLDPEGDLQSSRSAIGALVDAFDKDLKMEQLWLGPERARQCGAEFLTCFNQHSLTILTNHIIRDRGLSEGWFPISGAVYEWAFVAYDDQAITLLLVSSDE